MARQEMQLLRRMGDADGERHESASDAGMRKSTVSHEPMAINIGAITSLLGYFEGDSEMFEAWEKR